MQLAGGPTVAATLRRLPAGHVVTMAAQRSASAYVGGSAETRMRLKDSTSQTVVTAQGMRHPAATVRVLSMARASVRLGALPKTA